jgi:hypothetical protein
MKRIFVSTELDATPEHIWKVHFDPTYQGGVRKDLQIEEVDETEFEDTPEHTRIVYTVTLRRSLPDWVKVVMGDVRVKFTTEERFDKKTQVLQMITREYNFPNKIYGMGKWQVKVRPDGRFVREFEGEMHCQIPLVGGRAEKGLSEALQEDFTRINLALVRWLAYEKSLQDAGKPLPELKPAAPLGRHFKC